MITCREDSEWTIDLSEIDTRLELMLHNINRLEDPVAQRDLTKMYWNVYSIREEVSKEAVRCRNLNRTTGTMQRLQKSIESSVATVEQLLTLTMLMQ